MKHSFPLSAVQMVLLCASGSVTLYLQWAVYCAAVVHDTIVFSEGSSDSIRASHPHLAKMTLQGGPVFVCLCACVHISGRALWESVFGDLLPLWMWGHPRPHPLLISCVTPYCCSRSETSSLMPLCKLWLWKQDPSCFVRHIICSSKQCVWVFSKQVESSVHGFVFSEETLPSSCLLWYSNRVVILGCLLIKG